MEKAEAIKLAEKYKTPRYKEIERLERYVDGTIYDGRPDFFDSSIDVPLLARRPCVRYPVAQIAIRSHADMVLGEGKWPRVKLRAKDDAGIDVDAFESLIDNVVEQAELRSRMREGLEMALGARSVCFVAYVRRGKLGVQAFSGKACTLERNADGDPVKLTVEYPYLEEYKDELSRRWTWRVMLYRREVDERSDRVYVPVEAVSDGDARPNQIDKTKSRDHKLGFCPVDWYAFMPPGGHDAALDGRALHEHHLSELDAINIALSQRARAAHYAGDPQMWEAGVGPDEMPAPTGRGISGYILDANQRPMMGGAATGRKRGAGIVWSYSDAQSKAGILTLPGDALRAVDEHIQDLVRKVSQALAYVELDPEKAHTTKASSGRALEILLKPQVDFDCRIREDFGEHALCSVIALLIRVACCTNKMQPGGVYLDKLEELQPAIESFHRDVDGASAPVWMPPPLDLDWGPLFVDFGDAIKDKTDAAIAAKNAKIISARTATASIAHAFGVSDVDDELEDIAASDGPSVDVGAEPDGMPEGVKPPQGDAAQVATGAKSSPESPLPSTAENVPPMNAPSGVAGVKTAPSNLHMRATSAAGVADTVYQLLKDDYDDDAIQWVRAAHWEGPMMVDLSQIDFQNAEQWSASYDDDKVDDFQQKIADGHMKPIVLVNEPNNNKLRIIDGHHRALAYQKLGQPAMAYVAHVGTVGGPWDAMHSQQKSGLERSMQKSEG